MPIDQKEAFLELQRRGAFEGKDPAIINELAKRLNIEIPNNEPSKTESLLRGSGQGITMGFQDEASAGLEKGMIKAHNLFSNNKIPEPSYSEARDQFRAQNKKAQEANPYSYGSGQILGGIGATLPFGAGAATLKGMTTLGAANAMGTSDKEGLDLAKDTAIGGGIGLGLGLFGKGSSAIPGKLKDTSTTFGRWTMNLSKQVRDRLSVPGDVLGKVNEISETLINEGLLNSASKANTMEKSAYELMKKSGSALSDGYAALDKVASGGVVSERGFIDQIIQKVKDNNPLMDDELIKKVSEQIKNLASKTKGVIKYNDYGSESKLTFNNMWEIAQEIDDRTRVWQKSADPAYQTLAGALNDTASGIRSFLSESAEKVSPEIASTLAPNSKLYSYASMARKAFQDTVNRGDSPFKLSSLGSELWGRTLGSTPVKGAATNVFDLASKATSIPFGKQVINPLTKAAIIKSSSKENQ